MSRMGSILLEFGISLPQGHKVMKGLFAWLATQNQSLPPLLMEELLVMHEHYQTLNERIAEYDKN